MHRSPRSETGPAGPIAAGLMLIAIVAGSATAEVSLAVDSRTLNDLLAAAAEQEVVVPLAQGEFKVLLEDLKVRGFRQPRAGTPPGTRAEVLTSVRIRVPDLGISAPVEPEVSLNVVTDGEDSLLELRFERVDVPLFVAGRVDISRWLQPMRFPAESLILLQVTNGEVPVRSRLIGIDVGTEILRFRMAVDVGKPKQAQP